MNRCASCRTLWPSGGVDGPPARMVAAALDRNTGTVTELLEHVGGEPVDAAIRYQAASTAPDGNQLGLATDAPLLCRAVVLTGRVTGLAFVYAESDIATDRLPDSVRLRLETSRDPIGRVLLDHHLGLRREVLSGSVAASHCEPGMATTLDDALHWRRYRLVADGTPIMIVSEWFLQPVAAALATHLGGSVTADPEGSDAPG